MNFLQGQLTQDINLLGRSTPALPAACCDPKGRVIATLTLIWHPEAVFLMTHATVTESLLNHLQRYKLRAKVALDLEESRFVRASVAEQTGQDAPLWTQDGNGWRLGVVHESLVTTGSNRAGNELASARWQQLRLAVGVIDLPASCSAQFTPHMLNLDLIGAISFEKGCYTGQEIVARTQHLGKVKRRARLLRVTEQRDTPVSVGGAVEIDGTKAGHIVAAAGHVFAAVMGELAPGSTIRLDDGRAVAALD